MSSSRQGVVRQSSGSLQAVVKESSSSCQAVIRLLTGSCQAAEVVDRQSSRSLSNMQMSGSLQIVKSIRCVIHCLAFETGNLFILVSLA